MIATLVTSGKIGVCAAFFTVVVGGAPACAETLATLWNGPATETASGDAFAEGRALAEEMQDASARMGVQLDAEALESALERGTGHLHRSGAVLPHGAPKGGLVQPEIYRFDAGADLSFGQDIAKASREG